MTFSLKQTLVSSHPFSETLYHHFTKECFPYVCMGLGHITYVIKPILRKVLIGKGFKKGLNVVI